METEMMNEERAEDLGGKFKKGDMVKFNASGNTARGKITQVKTDGELDIPGSSIVLKGTKENPAALIQIYRDGKETDIYAGHRFSALSHDRETSEEIEVREEEVDEVRKHENAVSHRAMTFEASPIDEEKRTVRIIVSTEQPVMRSFGYEVLEHSPEAIDLSFFRSGNAPLLLDHDQTQQIGIIESVELEGDSRRLRAIARFGRGELATEVFNDVVDGIRKNLSVGYSIGKLERSESAKDTYVARNWKPFECSFVSIPADDNCQVRKAETTATPKVETDFKREELIMSESKIDIAAVEANAREAAHKVTAQIIEIGEKYGRTDLAAKAIREGKSVEAFTRSLLDEIGSKGATSVGEEIGMTSKEKRQFSLVNVVRALANPSDRQAQRNAEFEFAVAEEAAKKHGRSNGGFVIPNDVLNTWGQRDILVSSDTALYSDDFRPSNFIDLLRANSVCMEAGARVLTGLTGDIVIPKQSAASTAGWVTEGNALAESEPTYTSTSLLQRTLGTFSDFSKEMLNQSSMDIEMMIRDDLAKQIALAADLGYLEGSGAGGQPQGILGAGITKVATYAAAVPTYAEIVSHETAMMAANAGNNGVYIMDATTYGGLRTKTRDAGSGQFVIEPNGTINGKRVLISNQITAGNVYYGDFSMGMLIGFWGNGLELTVDNLTQATSRLVRVIAHTTTSSAVRYTQAFNYGNDTI